MRKTLCQWIPITIVLILVTLGFIQSDKQPLQIRPTQQKSVKDTESEPPDRRVDRTITPVFDAEAYYSIIIENNLFRPLGWAPRRPIAPYRLLGIVIPTTTTAPPKAIIQKTNGDRTYIVSPGEQLDADTEVTDIQPKAVTLSKKGTVSTLHLPTLFDPM